MCVELIYKSTNSFFIPLGYLHTFTVVDIYFNNTFVVYLFAISAIHLLLKYTVVVCLVVADMKKTNLCIVSQSVSRTNCESLNCNTVKCAFRFASFA